MKNPRPKRRSGAQSSIDTAGVLDDPRGFYVSKPGLPTFQTAVVGQNLSGELIYVETVLNRGDQPQIVVARPATEGQRRFYRSER